MIRLVRYHRLAVLAGTVLLAFAGLIGWMFYRQVVVHERFKLEARKNVVFKRIQPARRGGIADSRGLMLATSVPVKTVCADPSIVAPQRWLLARALAPLLELPEAAVLANLQPRLITNQVDGTNVVVTSRYAVLKHKVPLDQWNEITQQVARLTFGVNEKKLRSRERHMIRAIRSRGIFAVDDYQRQYPNGALAAHVVGFIGSGETEKDEGSVFEDQGLAGIELAFNDRLNGTHGWQSTDGQITPMPGQTVVLTLDAGIQFILETELAKVAAKHHPAGVIGIVMRPRTGEILALGNWPTFDPNRPGTNNAAFRNRAIGDIYEPGSTAKAITIGSALQDGVVSLGERVFCENGLWYYRGKPLHDHHRYGWLDYEEVVAKSSNIGTAKAAVRMGAERLYESFRNFGFGAHTLIPLPGEVRGILHPPKDWDALSITRIPIGHGIAATPLQMIVATSAIANGGLMTRPRLVDRFVDEQGRVVGRYPSDPPRRVLSEAAAREITRALKTVVSKEGTAASAQLDHYTAAGKTGTADKPVNGSYNSGKYYSSFIGFFPAENPEVCILVGVDEPDRRTGHMGSVVAAPAFKAIAERTANYLRIEPDVAPETTPDLEPSDPPAVVSNRSLALHPTNRQPGPSARKSP